MNLPNSTSDDVAPTNAQHDGSSVSTPTLRFDKQSLIGYNASEFIRIFRISQGSPEHPPGKKRMR
jgi:hypothetical protein